MAKVSNGEEGQQLLIRYLADHDASCPHCGYNLRGSTGDECPECGRPPELRVHASPHRAKLPAGAGKALVGFLAAGLVGMIAVVIVFELWPDVVQGPYGVLIITTIAVLPWIIFIVAFALLYRTK